MSGLPAILQLPVPLGQTRAKATVCRRQSWTLRVPKGCGSRRRSSRYGIRPAHSRRPGGKRLGPNFGVGYGAPNAVCAVFRGGVILAAALVRSAPSAASGWLTPQAFGRWRPTEREASAWGPALPSATSIPETGPGCGAKPGRPACRRKSLCATGSARSVIGRLLKSATGPARWAAPRSRAENRRAAPSGAPSFGRVAEVKVWRSQGMD